MELVFVSGNKHKLEEARLILPEIKIVSIDELGFHEEIQETATTLEGNALIKARCIFERYGLNCFSDDTGLEIDALKGAPGVYSARFAGPNASFKENVEKVLEEMGSAENRSARFRTSVALILNGQEQAFEGAVEGSITRQEYGQEGFGYDSIFKPIGDSRTFAQMNLSDKNTFSHRARAMQKLRDFLMAVEQ